MTEDSKLAKVLVVDDEVKMCFTLRKLLELSHYEVEIAHDGADALEKVSSFRPQCVLLDIRMPNSNGVDILRQIKAEWPETVVVMTTAVTTDGSRDQCFEAGAFDYLIKPINFKQLLDKIEQGLEAVASKS